MKKWVDMIWVWCGALIVDNDSVLLIHKTGKSSWWGKGRWAQPGGWVEFWETVQTAIKRELKEELNIEVDLLGDMVFKDDIRTEDWVQKHWVTWSCFAKIVWGELKNMEPDKQQAVKRFKLDELPDNIIEYTQDTIDRYKKYLWYV